MGSYQDLIAVFSTSAASILPLGTRLWTHEL